MILIDALYINNSGGKVLLDYLVRELENSKIDVNYLFDHRVKYDYALVPNSRKKYLKPNLYNRINYYRHNKYKYKIIFCFGNIPPFLKTASTTYVYFHQVLYLSIPNSTPLRKKILLNLKSIIIYIIRRNTNYWIVQTNTVADGLQVKFNIDKCKIKVIPFYPRLSPNIETTRERNHYLYVGDGNPHKNHLRLLDAFERFVKKINPSAILHLTVTDRFPLLINKINELNKRGVNVFNHGLVKREKLAELYSKSWYLVYPSLRESFGLGLIEAIENGVKVIGADLPYTYSVCSPSLVFDPKSSESIYNSLIASTKSPVNETKLMVNNEIKKMIEILKEK